MVYGLKWRLEDLLSRGVVFAIRTGSAVVGVCLRWRRMLPYGCYTKFKLWRLDKRTKGKWEVYSTLASCLVSPGDEATILLARKTMNGNCAATYLGLNYTIKRLVVLIAPCKEASNLLYLCRHALSRYNAAHHIYSRPTTVYSKKKR